MSQQPAPAPRNYLGNPDLQTFLEAFYAERLPFIDACRKAGLRTKYVRAALRDPAFAKEWKREMDVERALERASSIRVLADLRDTAESSRVKLEAAKALLSDPEGASARVDISVGVAIAGYVMDLSGVREPAPAHGPAISTAYVDVTPDTGSGAPSGEAE